MSDHRGVFPIPHPFAKIRALKYNLLYQSHMDTPIQPCYCYVLECADGTLYTGWTTDLNARVAAHNAGRGARYTRSRRPVRLVYWETLPSRPAALRREAELRRLSHAQKRALCASTSPQEGDRSC
jgi:putative endonuclease